MFHLTETLSAYQARDPAARSKLEVFLLYPGVHATMYHQAAHFCYCHKMKFLARTISQWSRFWTGIEIHPGAKIGRRLVIDHGMGIVIGETAEVGDDCLIYHGVTLGGTGKDQGKRHPTIGNNVMISAGAKVLGSFTIGDNSKIGAGSVVLSEVPPGSTVVGVPGRVVKRNNASLPQETMNQTDLPDPVREDITVLQRENSELTNRVLEMEDELKQLRRLVVMSAETGEQPQSAENDKTV